MEKEKVMRCLYAVKEHYANLEEIKLACNEQVDAELALLTSESEQRVTADDKKAIKKLGKAMATEKTASLENETQSLVNLLSTRSSSFQMSLFRDLDPISALKDSLGPGDSIEFSSGDKSVTLQN